MASYAMTGNGIFGGSNNFLGALGGIGNDWGDGLENGIKMGANLMAYRNAVHTNPSAERAQIAQNLYSQSEATKQLFANLPMIAELSAGLANRPMTQAEAEFWGVPHSGSVNNGARTTTAQGTVQNPTVATQPVQTHPASPYATAIPGGAPAGAGYRTRVQMDQNMTQARMNDYFNNLIGAQSRSMASPIYNQSLGYQTPVLNALTGGYGNV